MYCSFVFADGPRELAAVMEAGDEQTSIGAPGGDAAGLRVRVGELVAREGDAPTGWAETLSEFLSRLCERNRVVNLVSRASIDRIVELQVVPSLATLRLVPPGAKVRVLDVGSGGGFPAIPLKILRPDITLDLVEATHKKAEFLADVVHTLGLRNVRVHPCRIETPAAELRSAAPFDLAIARAVGNETLVRQAVRSLVPAEGAFWVFSGEPGEDRSIEWTDVDGRVVTVLRRLF